MTLDADLSYRALTARDARFDGLFFVGVTTTGIYCRPVCTARTPRRERCRFFSSAAAAEHDGFRACFVCRPELAPGRSALEAVPRLVTTAVRRISQGALNEGSVEELADSLGVTARHLRRAMVEQLGVAPVELAQTERLALAKRLLQDSSLSLAEVAFGAGFQSVRRFNSAFRARFQRSPSSVRRELDAAGGEAGARSGAAIRLRLDYRPPFAWEALRHFIGVRAVPGVEEVDGGCYRRAVGVGRLVGWISVEPHPTRAALVATVSASLLGGLLPVVARLRRLFDLDARPAEIDGALARDEALRPLVRATPGRRVPGAFDGFETAVRVVLGQQVTVKGATTLSGRLVERFGLAVETPFPALRRLFPTPARLAEASESELAELGLPSARARTVRELAGAVVAGLQLDGSGALDDTLSRLGVLPGFGPWTTQYVAMRSLGWPDAFPAADLWVLRALGLKRSEVALARAEAWRPWRAYATQHLWSIIEEKP